MEIYKFNINDDRDKVMSDLIEVYKNHMELFEDEAYCHFDVDDISGDIYVFNNTREAEYGCACDYIVDDFGDIPDFDISDCCDYFYCEMVEKAKERTSWLR
mgnify:CR=1 FL=1